MQPSSQHSTSMRVEQRAGVYEDARTLRGLLLAVAAVTSALLVLLATSKYGIAYHSDSARYVSVSKSLLAGTGFTEYTGEPYVAGGPLYPAVLAIGSILRIHPLVTARYLHAGLFAVTIVIGGAWLSRLRPPLILWLLGLVLIVTSAELMDLATNALTDMLFAACTVYSLSLLDRFLRDSKIRWLVLASIVASLACLTRYIGITIVMTGVAVLLVASPSQTFRVRIREAGIFATIASLPTGIWVLRNYLLSSTATGKRFAPFHTFTDFASSAVDVIGLWFLPMWVPRAARLLLGGWIVLFLCLGLVLAARHILERRRTREEPSPDTPAILVAAAFCVLYLVFLVVSGSKSFFSSSAARYTAPVVVPAAVVLIGLMCRIFSIEWRRRTYWWPNAGYAAAALLAIWPTRFLVGRIAYAMREGAGGYASTRWATSDVIRHLRAHPPRGEVFTNEPNALYFLGRVPSPRWIPAHGTPYSPITSDEALDQLRDSVTKHQGGMVVRFSALQSELASYDYSAADLQAALPLERLAAFPDGEIYLVKRSELRDP